MMYNVVTWNELIQLGIFLVAYTAFLYELFHNDHNK